MFSKQALAWFGIGLFLCSRSQAYYIDPVSCGNGDKAAFVRDGMNQAFRLADTARNQVNQQPWSLPLTNLVHNLFGNDDNFARQTLSNTFGNVLQMRNEIPQGQNVQVPANDVKVYCDQKRLDVRARDPLHYFDNDIQDAVDIFDKINCKGILAYTYGGSQQQHAQIQICEWFLQYGISKQWRYTGAQEHTWWSKLMTAAVPLIADVWYTPVDLISLFDKVMLHELTHTRIGGATRDVGGFSGYGWKNCRTLSTVHTNPANGVSGPELNADSYALFGSATYMITQGLTIHDDGTVTGTAGQTRRALEYLSRKWKEWTA